MRFIKLTKGYYATVDDEDFDWLNQFAWHASRTTTTWYAARMVKISGKSHLIPMHRLLVFGSPQVDHINSNGLDNQKHNLRHATSRQNNRYRRKFAAGHSSKFKGVSWDNERRLWGAQIRTGIPGSGDRLGRFSSEIEAAKAYDAAAIRFYGEFARLNFPDAISTS